MSQKALLLAAVLCLLVPITTYGQSSQKKLTISACGVTRLAFVKQLAIQFHREKNIRVFLNKRGGVNRAIDDVARGRADIGFGCRTLFKSIPKEKHLDSEQIAWGTLAFLVHKDNKVSQLSSDQVKGILLGKITNWKTVGGRDAPIHTYLRQPGVRSGVGYSLRKEIFKNLNIALVKPVAEVKNSDALRTAMLQDPNAFGVGDRASARGFGKLKILTVKNADSGGQGKFHTILRPYYAYLPKKMTPEAKAFLAYLLSHAGQQRIEKTHALSLNERARHAKDLTQAVRNEELRFDNALSMSSLVKRELKQSENGLNVYACGITRVAFVGNLIKKFQKKYGLHITTNPKGGVAFVLEQLFEKKADVAFVCRKPFDKGREKSLWCVQVAWGALGFIIHPKNRVGNVSKEQIKAILTGRITNWKALGGDDAPIHLYLRRGLSSGVGSTLREKLFGDKQYTLKQPYRQVSNSGELRQSIAKDRWGFGVDDTTSSQRVQSVKLLNIDYVAPTKRAILEGDYDYRRPFYACMREQNSKLGKLFVQYALSESGQKIVSRSNTANMAEGKDMKSVNNFILEQLTFQIKGRKKQK